MKRSILSSLLIANVIYYCSHTISCKKSDKPRRTIATMSTPEMAYDSNTEAISEEWEWADSNFLNISTNDSQQLVVEILRKYLDNDTLFVELSSGNGERIVNFAQNFPYVTFQPTEYENDPMKMANVRPQKVHYNLSNIRDPVHVDIESSSRMWFDGSIYEESVDYMFLVANLLHAAPLKVTTGIFEGAARYLKPAGYLLMYGPFKLQGKIYGDENLKLDRDLRKKNFKWGLREVWGELNEEAFDVGIYLEMIYKLPDQKNQIIAWKKDEIMQYHLDESKIAVDDAVTDMVNYFDDDYGDDVPEDENENANATFYTTMMPTGAYVDE
ncbi:methyltransferase-like 26 [Planococcus citri]|uniref:methyltransferase-like 26 n=1 Tax=Planococcus citri TaxID=170843 RepID=UPI0031F8AEEE